MYGYSADLLDHAKDPWGTAVDQKHHWWEFGYWAKPFFWDGIVVDGVWGTLKGLGGLAGLEGCNAFVNSWKGLGEIGIGLWSYVPLGPMFGPVGMAVPDSALPSWMQDCRRTTREAGKSMLAWDEWSKNPARAAGSVTFNLATLATPGADGAGAAADGAEAAGKVARVAGTLGRVGEVIDPMTYVARGIGKLPWVAEITSSLGHLRGLDDASSLHGVDGLHLPDGGTHPLTPEQVTTLRSLHDMPSTSCLCLTTGQTRGKFCSAAIPTTSCMMSTSRTGSGT